MRFTEDTACPYSSVQSLEAHRTCCRCIVTVANTKKFLQLDTDIFNPQHSIGGQQDRRQRSERTHERIQGKGKESGPNKEQPGGMMGKSRRQRRFQHSFAPSQGLAQALNLFVKFLVKEWIHFILVGVAVVAIASPRNCFSHARQDFQSDIPSFGFNMTESVIVFLTTYRMQVGVHGGCTILSLAQETLKENISIPVALQNANLKE
jgi:hypothetical protein